MNTAIELDGLRERHDVLVLAEDTLALLRQRSRGFLASLEDFRTVPITLTGATVLQLYKNRDMLTPDEFGAIAIGFVVSFIVALVVVKAFLKIITRYGFVPFAWYRIVAGAAALIWLANR